METGRPLISVITPVYNDETFLRNCLDSVLNQSLKDIEVICVDDGSTDSSPDILHEYASSDPRLTIVTQKNQGAGKARNAGLNLARGEFVAFLDADDWYPENTSLEHMYHTAIQHDVDICGGGYLMYVDGDYRKVDNIGFDESRLMRYSDYQYDYGYYNFIYRLRMLREHGIFFPDYLRFQDPPFFVRAMIAAGEFYAMDETCYIYRYGHQIINWNAERISDLIRGISDNLEMSREHKLANLHYTSLMRLERDYRKRIADKLSSADVGILRLLFRAESLIDVSLLQKVDKEIPDEYHLKLLHYAIERMCANSTLSVQNKMKKLTAERDSLKNSTSYKIGRMVTFLPGKIKRLRSRG